MTEAEECELTGVTVMKANRWAIAGFSLLGLVPIVAAIAALAASPHGVSKDGGAFLRVCFYAVIGSAIGVWYHLYRARRPSAQSGALRATRNGVYIAGKRLVARSEISSGVIWPATRHGTMVRIERKGALAGPIDLRVKDVAEGRALLHALGLDATQVASDFSATAISVSEWRRRRWLAIGGVFGGIFSAIAARGALQALGAGHGASVAIPILLGVTLYIAGAVQMFLPAKVRVGADGVLLRRLGTKRFIPIADMVHATAITERNQWSMYRLVRIEMAMGPPVDIVTAAGKGGFRRSQPIAAPAWAAQWMQLRSDILAERINEAIDGAKERPKGTFAAAASVLSRRSRPVSEWVAALRSMKEGTPTFREGLTLAIDELWKILEDPDAQEEKRAAAAVALSPRIDDSGRGRLRVAAQATVAPKLRVALEAAASDDDDRLIEALEEIGAPLEERQERQQPAP